MQKELARDRFFLKKNSLYAIESGHVWSKPAIGLKKADSPNTKLARFFVKKLLGKKKER